MDYEVRPLVGHGELRNRRQRSRSARKRARRPHAAAATSRRHRGAEGIAGDWRSDAVAWPSLAEDSS